MATRHTLGCAISCLVLIALLWAGAFSHADDAPAEPSLQEANRIAHKLPDFSADTAGILGPFYWGRAMDVGEDARFADEHGRADRDGNFLWSYGFARLPYRKDDPRGLNSTFIHARNNFVARHPSLAFTVQPWHFLLNTTGSHNSKIAVGYVEEHFRFEHGDNCDLEHLADTARVVLFLPVRHSGNPSDPTDQSIYFLSPIYSAQSPCVVEFPPGELIRYEWFRDPKNLDKHILYDLVPHFSDDNALKPGISKPMVQFDLLDEAGGWRVRIERDGRDGLAGGEVDGDWDLVITHRSPNAKPFTVDLKPANARWSMSIFSPGGSPTDTSEIIVGLDPYDRATGKTIDWPDRTPRIRTAPLDKLKDIELPTKRSESE